MSENPNLPQPHPSLKDLDRMVGEWELVGSLVGSDEKTIHGTATFRWLPGGFFLEQKLRLDFMGLQIESTELVGHNPETDAVESLVFANMSPVPLPYHWKVDGENVTITVSYGPLDATFNGTYRDDGTFSGGWRPNDGADQQVNVAYDLTGRRMS